MIDLLAAACFLGYLCAAVLLAWPRRRKASHSQRSGINGFIACALLLSFGAGLSQRDIWPFVAWPLVAGIGSPVVSHPRIMALDAVGVEHNIDYRAWQPLSADELSSWSKGPFSTLDVENQRIAAAHLLTLVERNRAAAARGERIGTFGRYLGPFTAPLFLLHPNRWSATTVPAAPIVGLRFYLETWNLEARARGANSTARVLIFEYRDTQ